MRHETIEWAYNDMDAARRLWPRVKSIIERQVECGEIRLGLADQRRLIAAVVNDLLEQEKQTQRRNSGQPKHIDRLIALFRKPSATQPQQQSA
jgi:hypothetical protein